jgi:hypothetical protein
MTNLTKETDDAIKAIDKCISKLSNEGNIFTLDTDRRENITKAIKHLKRAKFAAQSAREAVIA